MDIIDDIERRAVALPAIDHATDIWRDDSGGHQIRIIRSARDANKVLAQLHNPSPDMLVFLVNARRDVLELVSNLRTALATNDVLRTEAEAFKHQAASDFEEARQKHEAAIAALLASHEQESAARQEQHDAADAALRSEIARLKERHAAEREALISEHGASMTETDEAHEKALRAAREAHQEELDVLRSKHLDEVRELTMKIELVSTQLRIGMEDFESGKQTLLSAASAERERLAAAHDAEKANMLAAHESEKANMLAEHESAQSANLSQAQMLIGERDAEISRLEARNATDIEHFSQMLEESRQHAKLLEEALAAAQQEPVIEYDGEPPAPPEEHPADPSAES